MLYEKIDSSLNDIELKNIRELFTSGDVSPGDQDYPAFFVSHTHDPSIAVGHALQTMQ